MSRSRPPQRLDQLIDAAVEVFSRRGYRRTQMADVARALGVAPGTLYLYVSGKEALFDLVIRHAFLDGDTEPIDEASRTLPWPTPSPGATLARLRQRLTRESHTPILKAALARQRGGDPRAELSAIVRELYLLIARRRRGIKLLDRSALDWPELASLYAHEVRGRLIDDLTAYFQRNIERGRLRPLPHPEVAARLLLESIAWFAMHRHGDLQPPPIDDEGAIATITGILLDGLLKE